MPTQLPPLNIAETLGVLIPGDSLERLIDEIADPGCILGREIRPKSGSRCS